MNTLNACELDQNLVWQQFSEDRSKPQRDRLTESYLPLVRSIARSMHLRLGGHVEMDDLASAGTIGLMGAIESYDPSRQTPFEAYARPRIRGAMLDYGRSCDWAPRTVRSRIRRKASAVELFRAAQGRKPTEQELVEEMKPSCNEAKKLASQRIPVMTSLDRSDTCSESGQELCPGVLVTNAKSLDPAQEVDRKDLKEFLLRSLSQKERQVVLLYYYEDLNMREIGVVMELNESRISQMLSTISAHLRERLANRGFDS